MKVNTDSLTHTVNCCDQMSFYWLHTAHQMAIKQQGSASNTEQDYQTQTPWYNKSCTIPLMHTRTETHALVYKCTLITMILRQISILSGISKTKKLKWRYFARSQHTKMAKSMYKYVQWRYIHPSIIKKKIIHLVHLQHDRQ